MRERNFLINKNYAPELSTFGIITMVIKLLSAMQMTRTGRTSYVIKVSSGPGKYEAKIPPCFRPDGLRITQSAEFKLLFSTENHDNLFKSQNPAVSN